MQAEAGLMKKDPRQISWIVCLTVLTVLNFCYWIVFPVAQELTELPKTKVAESWLSGQFYNPCDMALDPERNRAYVLNSKPASKTDPEYRLLYIIDLTSGKLLKVIEFGELPKSLVFAPCLERNKPDSIFVLGTSSLFEIVVSDGIADPQKNYTVKPAIKIGPNLSCCFLNDDGRNLFVNSQSPSRKHLWMINLDVPKRKIEEVKSYLGTYTGESEGGALVGGASTREWILIPNRYAESLTLISQSKPDTKIDIILKGGPGHISLDRTKKVAYVTLSSSGKVACIDLEKPGQAQPTIIDTVTDFHPSQTLCSRDGNYLFVIGSFSSQKPQERPKKLLDKISLLLKALWNRTSVDGVLFSATNPESEIYVFNTFDPNRGVKPAKIGRLGIFNGRATPVKLVLSSSAQFYVVLGPQEQILYFDQPANTAALISARLEHEWGAMVWNLMQTPYAKVVALSACLAALLWLLQNVSPALLLKLKNNVRDLPQVSKELSAILDVLLGKFSENPKVLGFWLRMVKQKCLESLSRYKNTPTAVSSVISQEIIELLSERTAWVGLMGTSKSANQLVLVQVAKELLSQNKLPVLISCNVLDFGKDRLNDALLRAARSSICKMIGDGERIELSFVSQLISKGLVVLLFEDLSDSQDDLYKALRSLPAGFAFSHIVVATTEVAPEWCSLVDQGKYVPN